MVYESDLKPWMFEPATSKQKELISKIERVNDIKCTPNPTKLEASIFIDKQSKGYHDRLAKAIRDGSYVRNVSKIKPVPVYPAAPFSPYRGDYGAAERDAEYRRQQDDRRQAEEREKVLNSLGFYSHYGQVFPIDSEEGCY